MSMLGDDPARSVNTAMEICIGGLLDGAPQATGAVAIIDVFRAFTTAAVVLGNGASQITMVSTVEEASALRESGFSHICMERLAAGRQPASISGIRPSRCPT